MTKQQLLKKCMEEYDNKKNRKIFKEKVYNIINSGCLELSNYDDDYVLPKIMLSSYYNHLADQYDLYKCTRKAYKDEINNIKHFI